MKWIKVSDNPPDTVELEMVFRRKDGTMFVEYVAWDTRIKADNEYYEYLADSLPQEEQGWVSVEDRLPEIKKDVLLYYTIPHKDGKYEYYEVGFLDSVTNGGTYKHAEWRSKEYDVIKPTHWRPLPAPPIQ